MKYYLPFICFIILSIISCDKSDLQISSIVSDNCTETNYTESRFTNPDNSSCTVSMGDICNVIRREFPSTKSALSQVDIIPYTDSMADTLMYFVNYKNGGWKIYSSDKRTPPVLAEGGSGYFSLEEGSPAVAEWISFIAKNISSVRKATDAELSFSEEDICHNKAFWGGEPPRGHGDPIPGPDPTYPPGHWEEIIYAIPEYDITDHLVARWDQNHPYNECCPYLVSDPNTRAKAGCVAIAGAQMLLYLHNKLGTPVEAPSTGYCVGDISNYEQFFINESSSVWSQMSTIHQNSSIATLPEAILIGFVGKTVDMHYCDDIFGVYSWALPGNLKNILFEDNGISV